MARSSTARATLLLVAAFVAGGLIGGATMMVADKASHEKAGTRPPRPGYAERLTTELGLTSEQRQAVEAILERMCRAWIRCGGRCATARSWPPYVSRFATKSGPS